MLHGTAMATAAAHAGANSNVLSDELVVEPLTGNLVFIGIPVEIAPVAAPVRRAARFTGAMAGPVTSQPTPQRLAAIREQLSLLSDYL